MFLFGKRVKNGLKFAKSQIHTSGNGVVSARITDFASNFLLPVMLGKLHQACQSQRFHQIVDSASNWCLVPTSRVGLALRKYFNLAGMYGWILTLVRGYYTLLLTTLSRDCAHPMENVTNRPA